MHSGQLVVCRETCAMGLVLLTQLIVTKCFGDACLEECFILVPYLARLLIALAVEPQWWYMHSPVLLYSVGDPFQEFFCLAQILRMCCNTLACDVSRILMRSDAYTDVWVTSQCSSSAFHDYSTATEPYNMMCAWNTRCNPLHAIKRCRSWRQDVTRKLSISVYVSCNILYLHVS
jgi:hypothetical protein